MYQLVHPTLLQSIAFRLLQIYLPKIVRQCGQLSSSPAGSAAHLWWAMMIGWVIWVMKFNWNVKKAPPKSSKKEKLIFILCSTSDDWPSDPSNKSQPKCKKGPLSHQKIKCLFLDYLQLLVIGQAIQAMKVNQNMTKGPLSHQKMKYSFLYYVQLLMIGHAIQATKVNWNAEKGPLSHWKMKYSFYIMLDFWWSAKQTSDESWSKCEKMKCCFS